MASHAFHCSSGRSAHRAAAAATKLGWRTMTSASAPSGACSAASQGSQSKPGAFVCRAGSVMSV